MSSKEEIAEALEQAGEFLKRSIPRLRTELAFFRGEMDRLKSKLPPNSVLSGRIEHALHSAAQFESSLAGVVYEVEIWTNK